MKCLTALIFAILVLTQTRSVKPPDAGRFDLVDGGLTYLAFKALKAFRGNSNHNPEAAQQSEAYKKARSAMEQHAQKPEASQNLDTGQNREYTRSGRSR